MNFRRFETADRDLIESWLSSDDAGMRFIPSYATTEDYAHLIDFKKRFLWIASDDSRPIGFFDFEMESAEIGYTVLYIAPDFRRKNLGLQLLEEGLRLPEVKETKTIEAGVEKDNSASIRLLEKVGFAYHTTDDDGMLMYRKEI